MGTAGARVVGMSANVPSILVGLALSLCNSLRARRNGGAGSVRSSKPTAPLVCAAQCGTPRRSPTTK